MTDPKRSPRAEATADLFRILRAIDADPEVKNLSFRVAFTLANAVNARTGWAEIGVEKLTVKAAVSGQQARRARRNLEAVGWLRTVQGKKGQGTRYLLLDEKCVAIETRLKAQIDAIDDRRELDEIERRARLASQGMAINFDRETGEIASGDDDELPFKTDAHSPSRIIPILPQGSTSETPTGTVQDMAPAIPPPAEREGCQRCDECGRAATVNVGDEWFCDRHRPRISQSIDPEPDAYLLASRGG